jgi:hypothetical protein
MQSSYITVNDNQSVLKLNKDLNEKDYGKNKIMVVENSDNYDSNNNS